jgi:TonB family protein
MSMRTLAPFASGVAAAMILALAACRPNGELERPLPLYGESPIEYPLDLWDGGAEGTTVVRVRVTDTGIVDSVEVAESSGHPGLDSAAVAGARELRFQPGRRDGKRIRMWAALPIHFNKRPRPTDEF